MVTELPRVWIGGKEYYRDDRLSEFRAVDNPHERITFNEIIQVCLGLMGLISRLNHLFKAQAKSHGG